MEMLRYFFGVWSVHITNKNWLFTYQFITHGSTVIGAYLERLSLHYSSIIIHVCGHAACHRIWSTYDAAYEFLIGVIHYFFSVAGLLGPSTAFSTCPARPSFAASNWEPIAPSYLQISFVITALNSDENYLGEWTTDLLTNLSNVTIRVELFANGTSGWNDWGVLLIQFVRPMHPTQYNNEGYLRKGLNPSSLLPFEKLVQYVYRPYFLKKELKVWKL